MTTAVLDDTVARAAGLEVGGWPLVVVRRETTGDGFEAAGALHRPGPRLDACVEASAALGGTGLRHVGAQWWFERTAFLVAAVALACALTSGRVPSLRPRDVLLAEDGGLPTALALREAPLACAGGPEAALALAVAAQVEAHLDPLAAALIAERLRSARPLWRSAGDRTVQAALWVGAATGRRTEAVALARAALAPGGRLSVPVRLSAPPEDPACTALRSSCCLAHRTGDGTPCAGCPLSARPARTAA